MQTVQADPFGAVIKSAFSDITPIRLRLLLVVDLLMLVMFCSIAVSTTRQHEHSARTVAFYGAPSVMAAQEIRTGLEQMDVSLANRLLGSETAGPDESAELFEKARHNVCKNLVAAAKNITYGSREQEPIENLMVGLGRYEMQSQMSLEAYHAGNQDEAVQDYRRAMDTLEIQLLPNAEKLQAVNAEELELIYNEEKSKSALSCGLVLAMGIVLAGCLVITQMYFRGRFRRRLNYPLLLATMVTLFAVHELYASLRENAQHMKVAKEDSYDSLVALYDSRAKAYHANAAESRWLLDRQNAATHEKLYKDSLAAIAGFSDGHDFTSTIADIEKRLANKEKLTLHGFAGSMAEEFGNIRFQGEVEAALDALKALAGYHTVDERMRRLAQSGNFEEAKKLGLGYAPNESNYFFLKFDDAIDRAVKINTQFFRSALDSAFDELRGLILITAVSSVLIAGCIYFGFRPRLAEYVR
jgi:hypothetical protein